MRQNIEQRLARRQRSLGAISLHLLTMLCSILAGASISHAEGNAITLLGIYSHVESGDGGEHCNGYDVELWNHDGSFIGLINHHRGLCGDAPAGLLEDVSYDSRTGALSFRAKLTDGWAGRNLSEPTKDIIVFRGVLAKSELKGTICWTTPVTVRCLREETISLPRMQDSSWAGKSYATYEEWKKAQEPILQFRGPRW
ncbi:MAG: hypothetical protein K1X67_26755 [Fimbriimonadaceae bacterium]|nr:hypothetical protein [Fimbriimonadaceae bacterium]